MVNMRIQGGRPEASGGLYPFRQTMLPPVKFGSADKSPSPAPSDEKAPKPERTLWQRFWKSLTTNALQQQMEKTGDQPYMHIPEFFGDFLETEFMNDDWKKIAGKDILKYFMENQKKLDGQIVNGYEFGHVPDSPRYGRQVRGHDASYLHALENHFGFRHRVSQTLMMRNLIDSRILIRREEYHDARTGKKADYSDPTLDKERGIDIAHRLYLSERAVHLYKMSSMKPERRKAYLDRNPELKGHSQGTKLTTITPQMGEPRGYNNREIQPGALRRLGIALAIAIPAIGGFLYLDSQNRPEPTTTNQPVIVDNGETNTHPRARNRRGSRGQSIAQEPVQITSNRFLDTEEAITAIRAGELDKTAYEISHGNGYFGYVFMKTSGDRPQQMTLEGINWEQKARLNEALREAEMVVLQASPPTQAAEKSSGFSPMSFIMIGIFALLAFSLINQIRQRKSGAGKVQEEFMKRQMKHMDAMAKKTEHKAALVEDDIEERFSHVGGNYEAKKQFERLLSKIRQRLDGAEVDMPRGILLEGPPGNGKTLMARALAGEAGVPFLSVSGSDFQEMLVGVGPARIHSLFEDARKQADEHGAAIIFIDEFDSLGKKRSQSGVGGNEERENTLNALLKEMDGFEKADNIFVLAATNRKDLLDPALINRPSRFRYNIPIPNPKTDQERLEILEIHAKRVCQQNELTLAKTDSCPDILKDVAAMCRGLSGDKLQTVMKEAAELAVLDERKEITLDDCIEGFQTVEFGQLLLSIVNDAEREKVGYHEFGHMLTALAANKDPFVISMQQRSDGSLGRVVIDPRSFGEYMMTKQDYLSQVLYAMGGVAGETAKYGDLGRTSGLSSDIHKVRQILRQMLTFAMFENNYALDVLDPNRTLTSDQTELMNRVIDEAIIRAQEVVEKVGMERLDEMVVEALQMDKELIGPDAVAFTERHVPADVRQQMAAIADAFAADPTGEARRNNETA